MKNKKILIIEISGQDVSYLAKLYYKNIINKIVS
jgi:hypothetical protein